MLHTGRQRDPGAAGWQGQGRRARVSGAARYFRSVGIGSGEGGKAYQRGLARAPARQNITLFNNRSRTQKWPQIRIFRDFSDEIRAAKKAKNSCGTEVSDGAG